MNEPLSNSKWPSTFVGKESTVDDIHLSVVVRTLQGGKDLALLFNALMAQECTFNWEIVVVDNGSEDETLEICEKYEARVFHLPRHEFISGRSGNLGARNARGKLILFCSQHVVPIGKRFFENAAAPFSDPRMAAVRCLCSTARDQMANWHEPRDIEYESEEEQQAAESGIAWLSLYPIESCCVIRRSLWERYPLDESIEANEDKIWASEILRRGYKIRCCAEAVFMYTRLRSKMAESRFTNRCLLGLYRARGYVPLTWPRFFLRAGKALLLAPVVGVKFFISSVISDAYLVIIPWQARRPPRSGSAREYNKK